MEEDKKIEVYTGDGLSNTVPTSTVLTGEDALRSQVQADQEAQATDQRIKEETLQAETEKRILTEKKLKDNDKEGSMAAFASKIGKGLRDFATNFPDKIQETYNDPKRRFSLEFFLNQIESSSGYKPLTEAKGSFGQFFGNLQKTAKDTEARKIAERKLSLEEKKVENDALIKQYELALKINQPTDLEKKKMDVFYKRIEPIQKAPQNRIIFDQMSSLLKARIEKGDYTLPTGQIYSLFPTAIQAVNDILPPGIQQNTAFFNKITDEATFIQGFNKLTSDLVLGDIGQLVPVSDADIRMKKETVANVKDTPKAFVFTLRTQKAVNDLNAYKAAAADDYVGSRALREGSKSPDFDTYFNTTYSTLIREKILKDSGFSPVQLVEEAKKLNFQPTYNKYDDGKIFYSPLALAESKASLEMGGYDKYSKVYSSSIGSNKPVSVYQGNTVGTDDWRKEVPGLQKDIDKYKK